MKNVWLIWFLFVASWSFADGVPVDANGAIVRDHFTLEITLKQQAMLEHSRRISLTEEQQHILRRVWPLEVIDVLDPHYHDCTCGMYYAIWVEPDKIAFLGDSTEMDWLDEEILEEQYGEGGGNLWGADGKSLFIGIDGEIYLEGEKLFEEELKKMTKNILKTDAKYMVIYVAPKKGNENWEMVVDSKNYLESLIPEEIEVYWM